MSQLVLRVKTPSLVWGWLVLAGLLMGLAGCGTPLANGGAEAQPRQGRGRGEDGPAAVDVAVAQTTLLRQNQEYTGTTQPSREVAMRSRVEGQLIDLSVDVGDRVVQGQALGQLDDDVLVAAVVENEAEVAARQSEVAQAQTAVGEAQTQVEEARLRLQQATADLSRFEQLYREGAIPQQQVENARVTAGTARQALRAAEQQVRNRQQAVATAQRRVTAQQAIVAQERQRQAYTTLVSPVTGYVLEKVLETGNLAQPGSEILRLGDFSQVKVAVQVSERELGTLRSGQAVQIRLDAFPNRNFTGRISRISPAANPTSRLIPVEVIMANSDGQIGSGLLARVNFSEQALRRVVIPETALQTNEARRSGGGAGQRSASPQTSGNSQARASGQPGAASGGTSGDRAQTSRKSGTVFVISRASDKPTVEARSVTLGQRLDGRVEVLSGLNPGDRFVVRSTKALQDGASVQLSILSEG